MYDLHLLSEGPATDEQAATPEEAKKLCKEMVRIRAMDTVLSDLYKDKKVQGFCHLGIGQESLPVGISVHLHPDDLLISSYRCHGYALVAGLDPKEIICEQVGSVDGCAKGKGGSMHLYGTRFYGGHGIVGAQISLGIGLGFALKYRSLQGSVSSAPEPESTTKEGIKEGAKEGSKEGVKDDAKEEAEDRVGLWTNRGWKELRCQNVAVVCFGDGAANQGQLYESVNMAALWKLPVVFVCENNQYGMGTCVERASATAEFFSRFSFLPGIRADGANVFNVATVFAFARHHALTKGPIMIEYLTYRYNGHSMTDAFTGYRTAQEIEAQRQHDPIEAVRQYLGPTAETVFRELSEEAHQEMHIIKEIALSSPRCPPSDLFTDILI